MFVGTTVDTVYIITLIPIIGHAVCNGYNIFACVANSVIFQQFLRTKQTGVEVGAFIDKVCIRVEILHHYLFLDSLIRLAILQRDSINLINHLGKRFFSFFHADQLPTKHGKGTALKGNYADLNVCTTALLCGFQLCNKFRNLIHNPTNTVRGIQHEHHIRCQFFLCARQGQGHIRSPIARIQWRCGLGSGNVPLNGVCRCVFRCFFLIAAVFAGFRYLTGFGTVRVFSPFAVAVLKCIVLVAVGILIMGGIDCMADHLAVFPNGFSVDVHRGIMTLAFANRFYLKPAGAGFSVRIHTGYGVSSRNVNNVVVVAVLDIQYLLREKSQSSILNRTVIKVNFYSCCTSAIVTVKMYDFRVCIKRTGIKCVFCTSSCPENIVDFIIFKNPIQFRVAGGIELRIVELCVCVAPVCCPPLDNAVVYNNMLNTDKAGIVTSDHIAGSVFYG